MKKSILILATFFFLFSCGEDDNDTTEAPSCNAKLITLSTQASTISNSTPSNFQSVSYQVTPNFNISNFTSNTLSNNSLSSAWNYFFMEKARNSINNEYAIRYSNQLVKYNKTNGNLFVQTVNSDLKKPFYHNGNLRFLKYTNIDNTGIYSYDPTGPTYVKKYDVQVFDENNVAVSPTFTINLNENDGYYIVGNDTPVVSGNIVYYLGSAHLIALDLASNTVVKKNLFPFQNNTYRTFASGLVDSGGYLRMLKHVYETGISKIELIQIIKSDIVSSTPNTISNSTLFKLNEAKINGIVINNNEIVHLTNNIDKNLECMNNCGSRFYIVDLINGTSGNDSKVYELIIDGTTNYNVNVFTVPDTRFVLFDIEN